MITTTATTTATTATTQSNQRMFPTTTYKTNCARSPAICKHIWWLLILSWMCFFVQQQYMNTSFLVTRTTTMKQQHQTNVPPSVLMSTTTTTTTNTTTGTPHPTSLPLQQQQQQQPPPEETSSSSSSSSSFRTQPQQRRRRRRIHTCTIGNTTIQIPMTAPHFIIIGSQKSGSSALFQYLMDHPDAVPTRNYHLWTSTTQQSQSPQSQSPHHHPPTTTTTNAELTRSTETHFFDIHIPSKRQTNYPNDQEYWCHVSQVYATTYFAYDILLQNAMELEHFENEIQEEQAVATTDTIHGNNDNDNHNDNHHHNDNRHHHRHRSSPPPPPPHLFSFDKTPVYMTDASRLPPLLKSTLPWMTKIVVTLRDPIDRAYSAFNMGHGRLSSRSSNGTSTIADAFHTHTLMNLKKMVKAGLVEKKQLVVTSKENHHHDNHDNHDNDNGNDNDDSIHNNNHNNSNSNYYYYYSPVTNLTMAQENEAYRKVAKLTVARGLYEIQLRQWAQVYPYPSQLHVINFNTFSQKNDDTQKAQQMYQDLLQFLEVSPHSWGGGEEEQNHHTNDNRSTTTTTTNNKNHSLSHAQELFTPRNVRTYNAPMHPKTRMMLSTLYRPYNERLAKMLGKDWGVEEWK